MADGGESMILRSLLVSFFGSGDVSACLHNFFAKGEPQSVESIPPITTTFKSGAVQDGYPCDDNSEGEGESADPDAVGSAGRRKSSRCEWA